jgi:glycosyltransferase involved in cell wall biosynthesis
MLRRIRRSQSTEVHPVSGETKISGIILTRNEEAAVARAVETLATVSDDIFVVDSGSSDRTVERAREAGAQVVDFSWDGKYPKKKQWAMEHAPLKNEWVLFLDADERLGADLRDEIRELAEQDFRGYAAFDIPLLYVWEGRALRHGQTVRKRALVNRRLCHFPAVDDLEAPGSWEVEGHYQPSVMGSIGVLTGKIIHDDPDPVTDWFARHNRYSDWEAYLRVHPEAQGQVRAARSRQGQLFDRLPWKPVVLFLYSYVAKSGWRDGRAGLSYAIALSMYQWQIIVKVREYQRSAGASAGNHSTPGLDVA